MVFCRNRWLQAVLKPSEDRRCLFVGDLLGDGRCLAAPEQIRLILQQALCVRALLREDCGADSVLDAETPGLRVRWAGRGGSAYARLEGALDEVEDFAQLEHEILLLTSRRFLADEPLKAAAILVDELGN